MSLDSSGESRNIGGGAKCSCITWYKCCDALFVLQMAAIALCLTLGLEEYWKKTPVETTVDDFTNRVKYQPKPTLTWPLTSDMKPRRAGLRDVETVLYLYLYHQLQHVSQTDVWNFIQLWCWCHLQMNFLLFAPLRFGCSFHLQPQDGSTDSQLSLCRETTAFTAVHFIRKSTLTLFFFSLSLQRLLRIKPLIFYISLTRLCVAVCVTPDLTIKYTIECGTCEHCVYS